MMIQTAITIPADSITSFKVRDDGALVVRIQAESQATIDALQAAIAALVPDRPRFTLDVQNVVIKPTGVFQNG